MLMGAKVICKTPNFGTTPKCNWLFPLQWQTLLLNSVIVHSLSVSPGEVGVFVHLMFMLVGRQNNADNVVMALPLAFKAMKVLVFRPSQSMYYDILHSSWLSCISCLLTFWVSDMVFLGWFRCIDFSVLTYFICYLKKAQGHVFFEFYLSLCVLFFWV